MSSHFGAYFPAIPAKHDEVRLLFRHMAIDAVVRDLVSHLWMALDFVTVQTMLGEFSQVLLGGVNIVAGQTSHGGRLEAAAFFEQFDLAPVHIDRRIRVGLR